MPRFICLFFFRKVWDVGSKSMMVRLPKFAGKTKKTLQDFGRSAAQAEHPERKIGIGQTEGVDHDSHESLITTHIEIQYSSVNYRTAIRLTVDVISPV